VLPRELRKMGARTVEVAPAYRTVKPRGAQVEWMRGLAAAGAIDLVVFTSSSTVTNFSAMVGEAAKGLKAAVIGPITAETARKRGFEVVVRPGNYTVPALIAAIRGHFAPPGRARRAGAS